MKQYRTVTEAMKQEPKKQITFFTPVKPQPMGIMRPGKTAKDKGKKVR